MPHTAPAFAELERMVPSIVGRIGRPSSMLYVGWRHDTKPWWSETFAPMLGVQRIGVIEAFKLNFEMLQGKLKELRVDRAIHADVRKLAEHAAPGEWDVIFWDHGPEHVSPEDLVTTTGELFRMCGKAVIYACPWGDWPQGANDGNDLEKHRAAIEPDTLERLGMEAKTFGGRGPNLAGEIVAFRLKDRPAAV